ncbi:helix-turn-helix domain-containing protein [Edaphobacter sp. HDX4]|uniref:helix-turn-helix domain-containing protein n=1 Tax=Edaphobacter sp. HDX4 TaxID=2794064 RepID=UPI002FE633FE
MSQGRGLLGSSYLIWAARDCGLVFGTAQKKKGRGKRLDNEGSEPKVQSEITTSSVRLVLWALISRCNPRQQYSSFASQETLAADTGLSITTVKRALDHLIENLKLVDRDHRPYASNRYFIDTKTMHDAAMRNKAEKNNLKDERDKYVSPFDQPVPERRSPSEAVDSDNAGHSGVDFVRQKPADKEAIDRICMNIAPKFGNHPTYEEKDAERMVRGCVIKCVDAAGGDADLVGRVLEWASNDHQIYGGIANSRQLGGWIARCFEDWLKTYRTGCGDEAELPNGVNEEEGERLIDSLCAVFGDETEVRATLRSHAANHITGYIDYLREAVGPHLLSIRHLGDTIYADLSPAYRICRLLGSYAGQTQTTVPAIDEAEKDDVHLAMWATSNNPWAGMLREAGPEAYDEFMENYDEIAAACALQAQMEEQADAQGHRDDDESEGWDDDEPDYEPDAKDRLGL